MVLVVGWGFPGIHASKGAVSKMYIIVLSDPLCRSCHLPSPKFLTTFPTGPALTLALESAITIVISLFFVNFMASPYSSLSFVTAHICTMFITLREVLIFKTIKRTEIGKKSIKHLAMAEDTKVAMPL